MMMSIQLRAAQDADREFLFRVYASTRAEELAVVDWSEAQKESFLRMQSSAQLQHYATHYPGAEYQIILQDDVPIGRIFVDRSGDSLLLMDIALLPEYRNRGIGTRLIEALQDEAGRAGRSILLHVEPFNPACRLYQRLGFQPCGMSGIYLRMRWDPGAITEAR